MTKSSPARKQRKRAQKAQGGPQAAINNLQMQLMMSENRLRQEMGQTTQLQEQAKQQSDQFIVWMTILINKLGDKSVTVTDAAYTKAQKTWAGLDTKRMAKGMKFTLVTVKEVEDAQPTPEEVPDEQE